jgi:hypothetical protein
MNILKLFSKRKPLVDRAAACREQQRAAKPVWHEAPSDLSKLRADRTDYFYAFKELQS